MFNQDDVLSTSWDLKFLKLIGDALRIQNIYVIIAIFTFMDWCNHPPKYVIFIINLDHVSLIVINYRTRITFTQNH